MQPQATHPYIIRPLHAAEEIPFRLLLLADETREAIDQYLEGAAISVLEKDNKVIGIYVLQTIDPHEAEIKNIAVDTPFQEKGLGTLLLRHAAAKAAQEGYQSLLIGTGDASYRQIKLYRSEGFEPFHTRKNFFLDHYPFPVYENGVQLIDMIVLRKRL